jgi:plasmid maintenance system antidote protein VapI
VTAATKALSVTRAALSTQLNERANLSPQMALRVEEAFLRVDGDTDADTERL